MDDSISQRDHLEKLLKQYRQNLRDLEIEYSKHGINKPTELRNEIRETQAMIAQCLRELEALPNESGAPAQAPASLHDEVGGMPTGIREPDARPTIEKVFDMTNQNVGTQTNIAGSAYFNSEKSTK